MTFTNTIDEARYKKSSSTVDSARAASPYHANPKFSGSSSSSDLGQLVAIATAQTSLLGEIKAGIIALHHQRNKQFDEEKKRQFDLFQVNNRRIQQASQIGTAIAGNQTAGVASATANMAADALPGVAGKLAGSFGTLVSATASLTNAFVNRASEIASYSPSISLAETQADIRRTMADMREAQALGSSYAKLIESQTDLELTVREFLLPIKEFLIETLADLLKELTEVLKSEAVDKVGKTLSLIGNATMAGWNMLTMDREGQQKRFEKMEKNLEGIFNNTKPAVKDVVADLLTPLLQDVLDPNASPMPGIGPQVDPARQLQIPLFGM